MMHLMSKVLRAYSVIALLLVPSLAFAQDPPPPPAPQAARPAPGKLPSI